MKKKTYRTPKTKKIQIPVECMIGPAVSPTGPKAPVEKTQSEEQELWKLEDDLTFEIHPNP